MQMMMHPLVSRLLFYGGARCGKTVDIVRFLVNCALEFAGLKILVVRKELTAARASVFNQTFREYLGDYVPATDYEIYDSDTEIWFPGNGSVIYVDGLDDKERVEKIRGREYGIIYVNEATDTNYEAVAVLIDRLAQVVYYSKPDANGKKIRFKQMLLMDCNPKHPRHWIYQWCMQHIDPSTGKAVPEDYVEPVSGEYVNLRFHSLHWTPLDNMANLSAAYVETLKNLPDVKRRRLLLGQWCSNEGAVYEEFDEQFHVCDPFFIPNTWTLYRAIDFGYTNPFCCLWIARDHDGHLYIFDEHYKAQMLVEDHAEIIKAKSDGMRIEATVTDWEAEQRANLEDKGIAVSPAPDCKMIRDGIDQVKSALKVRPDGKAGLTVFRNCNNLVNEFYSYEEKPGSDAKNSDENPIDKHNHALGCVRYIVTYLSADRTSAFTGIRTDKEREESTYGF